MNKFLSFISKLFLLLSELAFFFFYIISSKLLIIAIIKVILAFIIVVTTIIDLIKKRQYDKKYSITILGISILILYTLFRPFLDYIFLIPELGHPKLYLLELSNYIYSENILKFIIIYILIFIGNYVNVKSD